jgi:hypothetical protein
MATEENDLDQLYTEMERVVGARPAATLMRHLPPVVWSEMATKADIEGLRVATKADVANLQQQITKLDTDLQVGLAKLESSILQRMTSQTLSTIFALVTVVIAISSVALIR